MGNKQRMLMIEIKTSQDRMFFLTLVGFGAAAAWRVLIFFDLILIFFGIDGYIRCDIFSANHSICI
jgi:hypothetical protein